MPRQMLAAQMDVGGRSLHVVDTEPEGSDAEAVVLVHGASLGSSQQVWRSCIADAALAGYRLIAYDQPGFGRSELCAGDTIEDRRAALLALVTALDLGPVHLVGHSQSGAICVDMAFREPRLFCSVTAVGTGSLLPGQPRTSAALEGSAGRIDQPPSREETREQLLREVHDQAALTDEFINEWWANSNGAHYTAFVRRQQVGGRSQLGKQLHAALESPPIPTHLVYGRFDKCDPVPRVANARRRWPGITTSVIDGAAHLLPVEAPDQFSRDLSEFISARVSGRGP